MNRILKRFIALTATLVASLMIVTPTWAGNLPFGTFWSSEGSPKVFLPGEVYTLTFTSSTDNVAGLSFSTPFALNPNDGGQFQIVPGGTCVLNTPYLNDQSCTVKVQFLGSAAGAFSSTLIGQCNVVAPAFGGYAISCFTGDPTTGLPGILGRFAGNGIATAVDALGRTGFATLVLVMLGLGAFFTLRRAS